MHKNIKEALTYVKTLAPLIEGSQASPYLAVPFTCLSALAELVQKQNISIKLGAQNMHDQPCGAFTGEISGEMLKEAGAEFVILGHSERRRLFGETSAFINRKIKQAFRANLQPILCIGETLQERDAKQTEAVIKTQLTESLDGISDLKNLILAYEPVWAIGTGLAAKNEDARDSHHLCRDFIRDHFGQETSQNCKILYGGSVNGLNAECLLQEEEIDGLLVGGASLSPEEFAKIVSLNR